MDFCNEHGRLPFVTDEVKPWEYRGWLLPYRIMAEAHPDVSPRYAYVIDTIDAGQLLDVPPPEIHFYGEFETAVKPGMKQLTEMMKIVEYKSSSWNAFRDICEWLGYAFGINKEPSNLDADVQEKLYRLFDLGPWLTTPTDYLGQFLAETRGGGWNPNAFFPTPMPVCEMMARMTQSNTDFRTAAMLDPAVGTGRMLMVGSNFCLQLFGQDIDPLVVLISKINLALYAPWHHIPQAFFPVREREASVPPVFELTAAAEGSNSPRSARKPTVTTPEKEIFTTDTEQLNLFEI